jgi:hypothetical protein
MGTWQNPAGRHRKIIKGKVNVWDLSKVNIDVETMWIKPKEISIALGGRPTGMLPVRSKMHGLKKSGPGRSTLVHSNCGKCESWMVKRGCSPAHGDLPRGKIDQGHG